MSPSHTPAPPQPPSAETARGGSQNLAKLYYALGRSVCDSDQCPADLQPWCARARQLADSNTEAPVASKGAGLSHDAAKTYVHVGKLAYEKHRELLVGDRDIINQIGVALASLQAEAPMTVRTTHETHDRAGRPTGGALNDVVEDLKNINFREEVIPVDATILASMRRDFVFWSAAVLAVVPLGLMTLEGAESQITGFCLFAAAMWGVIFARFIVNASTDWRLLVGTLFFTGLIGIPALLIAYSFLPSFYNSLTSSSNVIIAMCGSILHTGVTEELCKIVPVILYLVIRRQTAKPLDLVLIGVFSGLGFAAFENVVYVGRSVRNAFALTDEYGAGGLIAGVQGAMVNVLLRSLSCVFAHAVWSGIFSYFIAMAVATRRRFAALFLVGLATAAVLHGTYNGMMQIQRTVPAAIVFGSFLLFYAYLTRLRLTIGGGVVGASIAEGHGVSPGVS